MPITGVFKIKGVGDVVTGRIAQGVIHSGEQVTFGTDEGSLCTAKVFSCEMHHRRIEQPQAGDIIGINLKGLNRAKMPAAGDVLFLRSHAPKSVHIFTANIQVLHLPNKLRISWSPVCHAHTARTVVRLTAIHWRMNRDTDGKKQECPTPPELQSLDVASVDFEVQGPLTLLPFDECPALGRIVLVDGNNELAIGKVTHVSTKGKPKS